MKKRALFFVFLMPVLLFSQVTETFVDGNFTENPTWLGSINNFKVNAAFQLQSSTNITGSSSIFTLSEAFDDASWECWVKIDYTTSSSNFSSIYLISDKSDIINGCNAYYVQIGGTDDEVSLFLQQGTKKTKIIDGKDKRIDGKPVELKIKVTRDAIGNFKLFSKLASESNYLLEGTITNTLLSKSSYFGLQYSNTTTTGNAYFFDDIMVTGNKAIDIIAPNWNSLSIDLPNKLKVEFSEAMDFSKASFLVDKSFYKPYSIIISEDKITADLLFDSDFLQGEIYTLEINGLTDIAGNKLTTTKKSIGIAENVAMGDLIINEVMFENPENSLEYIEIFNTSSKVLDISGLVFTTRKTDGTFNTGNKIPAQTLLPPLAYAAFCGNAETVFNFHNCPTESKIYSMEWSDLNNESATILLTSPSKDLIYDELTYNTSWHHTLIKNTKGVALERINPQLPTQNIASWHSAASEVNYGTPGYKNSQYREINTQNTVTKTIWVEPEAFSPDNDGIDDICIIHYRTEVNGYVAKAVIFNAVGVKVKTLTTNLLLSSEGFFTWDGKTDKQANANSGIYVLYFEMFNPQIGLRKQLKLPIVVSAR